MSQNTWPNGVRKALDQSIHERWNTLNYPGTRQLCEICENPTGRCEEDSLEKCGEVLCEDCYKQFGREK
jgi:hypothetical protein